MTRFLPAPGAAAALLAAALAAPAVAQPPRGRAGAGVRPTRPCPTEGGPATPAGGSAAAPGRWTGCTPAQPRRLPGSTCRPQAAAGRRREPDGERRPPRVREAVANYDRPVAWREPRVRPDVLHHEGIDQNCRGDIFSVARGNFAVLGGPAASADVGDALFLPRHRPPGRPGHRVAGPAGIERRPTRSRPLPHLDEVRTPRPCWRSTPTRW